MINWNCNESWFLIVTTKSSVLTPDSWSLILVFLGKVNLDKQTYIEENIGNNKIKSMPTTVLEVHFEVHFEDKLNFNNDVIKIFKSVGKSVT